MSLCAAIGSGRRLASRTSLTSSKPKRIAPGVRALRIARIACACLLSGLAFAATTFAQEPPATRPATATASATQPAAPASPAEATVSEPAPTAVASAPLPEPIASPAPAALVDPAPAEAVVAPAAPEPVVEPEPPAPSASPVPAPPTWRFSDSLFSRYEARRGYEGVGKAAHPRLTNMDAMFYRARVGVHLNPVSFGDTGSVSVTLEPQASGVQGTSAGLTDPNVGMHQAFIDVGTPGYRLEAGRFEMVYGDHLVIGNVGWHETAQAFDGLRVTMRPGGTDSYGIDLFATLVTEGFPGAKEPFGAGDKYFVGAYFNDGGWLDGDLDFYLLSNLVPSMDATVEDPADPTMTSVVETASAIEVTLGARVKGTAGSIDYRAEAGYQLGSRPTAPMMGVDNESASVSAYQADAEVGVKVADTGLRLSIEGLVASGDDGSDDTDNSYNHLYPTAHKWLGLADVFGARSNVLGGVGHVAYAASEQVALNLDVHLLSRMEEGAADSAFMGTEFDTGLEYTVGAGVKARAMYAVVMPNKDIWGDDKPVHFLEIELSHNLK